jgi:hypothetical protein
MTLQHIDTAIGFATLMLLLSLLITVLVQTTAAVLRLRGSNLFHGVVRLLKQADPSLSAQAEALADLVLRHPTVSHTANQRATAIGVDEFIRVLRDVGSRTQGEAIAALKASIGTDFKQLEDKVRTWFDTVMSRTTERFTLNTRWWTAGIALALAGVLQIDSLSILKRLSTDSELRAKLVASSQTTLRLADSVTAITAKTPPAPGATQPPTQAATDTLIRKLQATQDSITKQLNQTGFAFVPDPYPGIGAYRSPRHVIGTLMTVLFLSLGGPFWFNVLSKLANLRPSLAGKVEKEKPSS